MKVDPSATVITVAGIGGGAGLRGDGIAATVAAFDQANDTAIDPNGNLLIAE